VTAKCPVCTAQSGDDFLERANVPVHQNLVIADRAAARSIARGTLSMAVCSTCGFIFNRAVEPEKLAYGAAYDNTQAHSAYFDGYMDDLAARVLARMPADGATVVEVGCGKGQFLRKILAAGPETLRAVGFDPSYVGPDTDCNGRLSFRRAYYDDGAAALKADIVICRHVIEHVPAPLELLASVRAALQGSPSAIVFFETPCVAWILRNAVVWDLFYEHCSLFSSESLAFAFARGGFSVDSVEHTFGGQYLWLTGGLTGSVSAHATGGAEMLSLARSYADACAALGNAWTEKLAVLKQRGPIALWGGGAKGVTFANLIDPDATVIDCVVDMNPNKQGCFIPGTGHAIVSPEDLVHSNVQTAVLLNPNYRAEVAAFLAAADVNIDLIDWSDS
jgi:SAM-dependent methyltransferase